MRGQKRTILQLLKRGPQTNHALSTVALKYTNRISDLRNMGFDIRCERRGKTQTYEYTLNGGGG